MTCPSCGAPMKVQPGKDYFTCEYCNTIQVPEDNADGVRVLGEPSEEPCPRCGAHLVSASVAEERILYCEHCRGMLIGMDVFLVVVEQLRSRHETGVYIGEQPDWSDLDRHANCPHCSKQMDTHEYGGGGNVIIDTCEECELNWLDYGELQRIVRAPDQHYVITVDEDERLKADPKK